MLTEFKQFITNLDNEIELPYGTVSLWFDGNTIHLKQTLNKDENYSYETTLKQQNYSDEDIKSTLTELCKDARDHLEFMQREYIKDIEYQIQDITPIIIQCWSSN